MFSLKIALSWDMIVKLLTLVFLFCCPAGFSQANEAKAYISPASLMPQKGIEYQQKQSENLQIADSLIKHGIELTNERDLKSALEFFNKALAIAVEFEDAEIKFLALNNLGLCYYYSSEYARSLDYFLESYETAIRHLPVNFELTSLNNISVVYKADGKHEKALEYVRKAYENALKMGLNEKAALYGINLGSLYNDLKKYKKAREILNQVIVVSNPKHENYYLAMVSLSESYEKEDQLEKAHDLLTKITLDEVNFSNNVAKYVWISLARVNFALGNFSEAVISAQKGIEVAEKAGDIQAEFEYYKLLSKAYEDYGELSSSLKSLKKANLLNDSIKALKNQEKVAELQARFDISQYEIELSAAEERYNSLNKFYINIILLASVIIILIFYALRIKWINMRQKNNLLEKQQKITSLEVEKAMANKLALEREIRYNKEKAALNEKILREELELKNKEVSSKALMNAAQNEIIHQVIHKIGKFNHKDNKSLSELVNELKNTIDIDKDWNDFVVHFEQIHSGFFQKLLEKHNHLNNNDLRFAAYLKINLGGKEIARLLNITPASYRKRKMRLKEKLGLEHKNNLEKYINTF